jgi:transcriptional regulator with XRE-family HTH domain
MWDKTNLVDIETNIGQQLKMLRISKKISQKHLAGLMGITYQQVQKYENGLNRISVSRLWQYCRIFNISPDFLFEGILNEDAPILSPDKDVAPLIPNIVASSQDIKLMLAFQKIGSSEKKALMIKVCEAMIEEQEDA